MNTYSGGTVISNGTVQLGSATALGTAANSSLVFSAASTGMLQLYGNNVTVSDLNTNASAGLPIIENGSPSAGISTLSVNTVNADTYAGLLQDGGVGQLALFKTGPGSLTLAGSTSFSGGVAVNSGTLSLLAPNGFSGGVNIGAGVLLLGNSAALKARRVWRMPSSSRQAARAA